MSKYRCKLCQRLSAASLIFHSRLKTFLLHKSFQLCRFSFLGSGLPPLQFLLRNLLMLYEHDVRPSVCPSVCKVGGFWSHSATKTEINTRYDRSVSSWLPACWRPPGSLYHVIQNSTEEDQWGVKRGVLHFDDDIMRPTARMLRYFNIGWASLCVGDMSP